MKTTTDDSMVRPKAASSRKKARSAVSAPAVERSEHIAVAAYYKAEARGFAPGFELEDWLQAEVEQGGNPAGAL